MPEFLSTLPNYLQALVDACFMIFCVVVLARLVGLRSFAKFTSFDFALTVATGSAIASVIVNPDRSVLTGGVALVAIFGLQWLIASVRFRVRSVHDAIRNTPLLLMRDGVVSESALAQSHVTRTDLMSKLRAQGVASLSEVAAVVLETTGDVSVILRRETHAALDDELLSDVQRAG